MGTFGKTRTPGTDPAVNQTIPDAGVDAGATRAAESAKPNVVPDYSILIPAATAKFEEQAKNLAHYGVSLTLALRSVRLSYQQAKNERVGLAVRD